MTFEQKTKKLIRRLDTMAAKDIRDEVFLGACAEYGDFPATCYRKTRLLTGQ